MTKFAPRIQPYGVMVAHQILDLLVLVRIQVGLQAFAKTETLAKAFFIVFFCLKVTGGWWH